MDDSDDVILIKKAKKGDLKSFSELVKRYQGNVRACLIVRLSSKHEAEDLAQEAFIVAYKKLAEFENERAFGPWVRSIAFNLLRNHVRKHRAEGVGGVDELQILIDSKVEQLYPENHESDTMTALKRCLGLLDDEGRRVLKLHYHDELSVKELREKLGVKHSTLTMRLHRLRDQLKNCILERSGQCEL